MVPWFCTDPWRYGSTLTEAGTPRMPQAGERLRKSHSCAVDVLALPATWRY